MKRLYENIIKEHFKYDQQMAFLAGPRQVGKTTVSKDFAANTSRFVYLNWDTEEHRQLLLPGPISFAKKIQLTEIPTIDKPIIVFDEIHKYAKWKSFLKGFYDNFKDKVHVIVTGSSKLDIFRRGADSLMGRYFLYRVHPLSVAECICTNLAEKEISKAKQISTEQFDNLLHFGGFPEPFIKHNDRFTQRWRRLRKQLLFNEDIRNLSQIQEISQMELLAEVLRNQVGQLISYTNLANKTTVSINTIKRWFNTLERFYYCFLLKPWTKNVIRSLLKEPKVYLWDWALVDNIGARIENFVASHLLKAVHLWTDIGLGEHNLHFIRDKEKREVDFMVSKNDKPWFLVEVKLSNNQGISKSLYRFQEQTSAIHAFQVVIDMEYRDIDCFSYHTPIIVPAKTFLSQLV